MVVGDVLDQALEQQGVVAGLDRVLDVVQVDLELRRGAFLDDGVGRDALFLGGFEDVLQAVGIFIEVVDQDFRSDIGILVDAVSEVLEIPASEIEPPPSFGAKIRADFIFGMGKVSGKFVIILNINNVLSIEEISMLTDVATEDGISKGGHATPT